MAAEAATARVTERRAQPRPRFVEDAVLPAWSSLFTMAPHPLAWSTISAVNGGAWGGVTWNDRPHFPTITSAGAARE